MTEMGPVVEPAGTTAVICVALTTVNEAAAIPLNATPVVPDKFVPVIVTVVPTMPLEGAMLVMLGATDVGPLKPPAAQLVQAMSVTFASVLAVCTKRPGDPAGMGEGSVAEKSRLPF